MTHKIFFFIFIHKEQSMNNNFITYKGYGLGVYGNLVYSFIVGWGDKGTYATNKQIADITQLSVSTVNRTLRELNTKGYINISNPNTRSRHIYVGHTDPHEAQTDTNEAHTEPLKGSDRASNRLTESPYNTDTINNRIDNMISNNISNNTGENYFEDFMNRKKKYDEIKKS